MGEGRDLLRRQSRVVALAFLLSGCAALAPPAQYEIVGYYPAWAGPIEVDARQLTVINYAFLDIDAQGRVVLTAPAADRSNFERLRALRAANARLKLVASVGGWTRSSRFSDVAAEPVARSRFIDSVVAFLREHRFDGIDIDWEYPGAIGIPCASGITCERKADKANFVTLVRALRTALDAAGQADGKRYLATIAAGADQAYVFDEGSSAWLPELARSLDWINLMTYDYHGTWENAAGFVAPLYRDDADPSPVNADASVALYLAQGIAPGKITLGQPFYGKGWEGCAAGARGDGLYQGCAGPVASVKEATFTFADLIDKGYLRKDPRGRYTVGGAGFTRHWNPAARVPYLYNPSTKIFIAYDDEASIHEKNRYVIDKRLRGAMYWELDADRHRVLGGVVANDLPH